MIRLTDLLGRGSAALPPRALVDARIDHVQFAVMAHQVLAIDELRVIDVHPSASGPELEATFGPFDDVDGAEAIVTEKLRRLRITPLAIRTREVAA